MTQEPIPRQVELVAEDRSKTGTRKRMSPERQREINEKVELCRQLLRENWTKGDIQRAFRQRYNVSARTVARYLRLAYKRNCQILDRTEDEITAFSLGFWGKQQRDCAERIQQAKAQIQDADQEIETARVVLDSPNASIEKQEIAVARIREANKQTDNARRMIYSAEQIKMSCQDRIDKITAPGKYNRTERSEVPADGNGMPQTIPEPINAEKTQSHLRDMLNDVMAREGVTI